VNIPIVYEDDWLLVVDKPPGLLSIPTPKNERRTLTSILNDDAKEKGLQYRLHPCHRLDRETSGLIIYAKGKSIQRKMMEVFQQRKVKKTYIAFIQGSPAFNKGEIKNPIAGQPALTQYKTIAKRKGFAIVEAMPLTGRTNQIRIHFKGIGHPIVGETKYAFRRDFELKAKRLCLHAKSLEFRHPLTHKNINIDAKIPKDLEDFLNRHPE
jgi:23S rRNA pseudouridine1911/1915/1917 synthase